MWKKKKEDDLQIVFLFYKLHFVNRKTPRLN